MQSACKGTVRRCACGQRLLSSSAKFSASSPSSSSTSSTASRATSSQDGQSTMRRQRQTLSVTERNAFNEIFSSMLPSSTTNQRANSGTDLSGERAPIAPSFNDQLEEISRMLSQKVSAKDRKKMRKHLAQVVLTAEQEIELDKLREQLMDIPTDYELLRWSMQHVFGLPPGTSTLLSKLPSDAPGPRSPLYPSLLLSTFVTLRDSHRSPQMAMHVFTLACSSTESFLRGCTNELYEQVLRTRWIHGAGDIESVLSHVETMIDSGLRLDKSINDLVDDIGLAIRADQEIAMQQQAAHETVTTRTEQQQQQLRHATITPRYFSSKQIAAWNALEAIVDRQAIEADKARRKRENEKWTEWALRKAEEGKRDAALANEKRPNVFFDDHAQATRTPRYATTSTTGSNGRDRSLYRSGPRRSDSVDADDSDFDQNRSTQDVNASWAKFFENLDTKTRGGAKKRK